MMPIWVIPDWKCRYEGRDQELRAYLRAEYGSPDGVWLRKELKASDGKCSDGRFGARVWSALTAIFASGKRDI